MRSLLLGILAAAVLTSVSAAELPVASAARRPTVPHREIYRWLAAGDSGSPVVQVALAESDGTVAGSPQQDGDALPEPPPGWRYCRPVPTPMCTH